MSDSQSEQPQQGSGDAPGKFLKKLREQQNLSIEDISKRIHLEPKMIEAIEKDDYTTIPTATYARGYLRSYAKTLGADADHVVSLYNTENEAPPPEILPEVKPPSQVSSSDKPVKAFTYLITLGLFLLILIWYQSNYIVGTEAEAPVAAPPVPDVINNTDTTFDVVVHPEGWQTPPSTETNPPETLPEISSDSQNSEISNLSITEQMNSLDIDINTAEPETPEQEETTEPSTIVADGSDRLVFEINQDSWLEVYDSSEQQLFMNLAKKNERIEITGSAPFNLIIGYSPGVSIQYNDRPFDPEPFSINGVARFELPAE